MTSLTTSTGVTSTETHPHSAQSAVGQYFRMWNDGDLSLLTELLSPEWVNHAHPEWRCAEDVMHAIITSREQHPDTQVLVDAVLGGTLVTVYGRIVTGGHAEKRAWIVRVEHEQLQELWSYAID